MRRLAALIALIGTGIALGQPALPAAAARRTHASNAVVCPLIQSRTVAQSRVVTCCGPPTASADAPRAVACCYGATTACCQSSAVCVAPLTISSSPDPSSTGQRVKISGLLASGGAGTAIRLWQKLPADKRFTQVAETITDASGAYAFTRTPGTNRQWYVTSAGETSTTLSELVRASVTLKVRRHAGRLLLTGAVKPAHTGQQILIQRLVSGSWQTIAKPRLHASPRGRGHGSRFGTVLAAPGPGKWQLRAELRGDARNVTSDSAIVTVSI